MSVRQRAYLRRTGIYWRLQKQLDVSRRERQRRRRERLPRARRNDIHFNSKYFASTYSSKATFGWQAFTADATFRAYEKQLDDLPQHKKTTHEDAGKQYDPMEYGSIGSSAVSIHHFSLSVLQCNRLFNAENIIIQLNVELIDILLQLGG